STSSTLGWSLGPSAMVKRAGSWPMPQGTSVPERSESFHDAGTTRSRQCGIATTTRWPRRTCSADNAATTSPSPPTFANAAISLARCTTDHGGFTTPPGSGARAHVAQVLGSVLRRRGIDVEAGPDLEPRDPGELRHDLQVPVEVGQVRLRERRRVQHQVV